MNIMLARIFQLAAHLATKSVPLADRVPQLHPTGTVIVRCIRPQAVLAQSIDRLLRDGKPVACGLQFGGRQVKGFLAQVFAAVPAQFAEPHHLRGHLEFAPTLGVGELVGFAVEEYFLLADIEAP